MISLDVLCFDYLLDIERLQARPWRRRSGPASVYLFEGWLHEWVVLLQLRGWLLLGSGWGWALARASGVAMARGYVFEA